jgi:AcrR family transcriptional regulator
MSKYSHYPLAFESRSVANALSPRKLPLQARAQATRDAILEGAAQILSAHGLAGFNTNAVAQRAGVSIGSLYQYFANKDALMAALIHAAQARQLASLMSAAAGIDGATLEQAVRMIVRGAMQHHRDDSLLATAIDHEEARLDMDGEIANYLDRGGLFATGLLARYAEELGPIDPATAARTLPVMVRAVVDAWANQSPPDLQRAEDEAVRAVLGYLRARPA